MALPQHVPADVTFTPVGRPALAAKLPLKSRSLHRAALDRRRDLHLSYDDLREQMDQQRLNLAHAERDLDILKKHYPNAAPDDRVFGELSRKIDALRSEVKHLADRRSVISDEMQPLTALLNAADRWLPTVPSTVQLTPAAPVALRASDAVDALREKAVQLRLDIDQVRATAWPLKIIMPAAMAEVDRRAAGGKINIYGLIENGPRGEIAWPEIRFVDDPGPGIPDTLPIVCWIFRNEIKAAVAAELTAACAATESSALDADQRAARIAKLQAELLEVERREVACCERDRLPLRGDVDVRAWLQVDVQ